MTVICVHLHAQSLVSYHLKGCRCLVQWLIYNDCLFRWRQAYEYLLFVDRDEFLHFPGKPLSEVPLPLPSGMTPSVTLSFAVTLRRHCPDNLHCRSCMHIGYQAKALLAQRDNAWPAWTAPQHAANSQHQSGLALALCQPQVTQHVLLPGEHSPECGQAVPEGDCLRGVLWRSAQCALLE